MLPSLPMILSPQRDYQRELQGEATSTAEEPSVASHVQTEWPLTPSSVRIASMRVKEPVKTTSAKSSTTKEKKEQLPEVQEPLRTSEGINLHETDGTKTNAKKQVGRTNQESVRSTGSVDSIYTSVKEPLHNLLKVNTIVPSPPKSGKKKPKQIRHLERTLNCLLSDNDEVKDEKSFAFAQAYFLKITERLEGKDETTLNEFLKTMNEFGSTILDATDLYKKITKVLKKYPDLCEEFLAFLLPEQALECGKFMEYLMLTNMKNFCRMLELYYSKQPSQLRKIYSSLSVLASKHDATMEDVQNLFLPHLRNNSLLANTFLQLLPTDHPRESSLIDYDHLDFSNIDIHNLKLDDWFETIQVPTPPEDNAYGGESCVCPCHITPEDKTSRRAAHCISCKTKFLNGRIYIQTGKVLRPAKVSFTELDAMERLSVKDQKSRRKRERSESVVTSNKRQNCGKGETVTANVSPSKPQSSKSSSRGVKHKGGKFSQKKGKGSKKVGKSAAQEQKSAAGRTGRSTKKSAPPAKKPAPKADSSSSRLSRSASRAAAAASAPGPANQTVTRSQSGSSTKDESLQPVVVISKKLAEEAMGAYKPSTSSHPRNKEICDSTTHGINVEGGNVMKAASESEGENAVTSTVTEELELAPSFAAIQDDDDDDDEESPLDMGTSAPLENVLEPSEPSTHVEQGDDEQAHNSTDDVEGNNESSSLDDEQSKMDAIDISSNSSQSSADVEDIEDIDIGTASSPNDSDEIVLSEDESGSEEEIINRPPSISWTRDEDKIILQTFQTENVSEVVFEKLQSQLPARSADEIRNRFKTLMSYLQRMAGMQESSQ